MTAGWRDHMIMWSKDVGRSVDYLESRSDIAKDKIGYMGCELGRRDGAGVSRDRAAD